MPRTKRPLLFWAAVGCACAALVGLGTWQVHRLAWKRDLIAHVTQRVSAPAEPAPGVVDWGAVNRSNAEYRHVAVTGTFLDRIPTLVQAVTTLGPGHWAIAPFHTDQGYTVLINRGFVPADWKAVPPPAGRQTIIGLLRISEPGGAFLRSNQPHADRWYSRDVAAIAKADGLTDVAPYFIDADGTPNPDGFPVGGLTVTRFPNNHLVYAITWYGLAILILFFAIRASRSGHEDQ